MSAVISNELLRAARLRTPSHGVPGCPTSRNELASRVNEWLLQHTGKVFAVDERTIGRWERGAVRLPSDHYRAALRAVLNVDHDWELGFGDPPSPPLVARPLAPKWASASGLNADEAQHLAAALADARRYLDVSVVGYFQRQLALCMADDGTHGPTRTLPVVLGIVGVVQQHAREAKPDVRRRLLQVGARGAEFAGWLYRDASQADRALYWRDRASEWALEAEDWSMLGYVLLKKSQAAWDERDALGMLTLAQAAQTGPWTLPPLVRAEVAQQEARGLAMTGERSDVVERKLDEARKLSQPFETRNATQQTSDATIASNS